MGRQMGFALAMVLSLATVSGLRAQSEQQQATQPKTEQKHQGTQRRMWWKDENVRAEVGFNVQQANEIDKIYTAHYERAVSLWREVNELDKAIEKMIVSRETDIAIFTHTVEKVEARRAELNKMRTLLLYRISRVLTPEQNAKFKAREAARRKQDGDRRK